MDISYSKSFFPALLVLLIFQPSLNTAQPKLFWENRFSGATRLYDVPVAIKSDKWGNVFIGGNTENNRNPITSYDFLLIKYDSIGDIKWTRNFNSPEHLNDELSSVLVDDSGCVFLAGFWETEDGSSAGIVKYNGEGIVSWQDNYTGPGSAYKHALFMNITSDEKSNIYVCGHLRDSLRYFIKKYKSSCEEFEFISDEIRYFDNNMRIFTDSTDHVYGYYFRRDTGTAEITVVKCDSVLNPLWSKSFNIPGLNAHASFRTSMDPENNIYVLGNGQKISKIDADGNQKFTKDYILKDIPDYFVYWFDSDSSGNTYSTGYKILDAQKIGFLIKYNNNGEFEWERKITNDSLSFYGFRFDFDEKNNIYLLSSLHSDIPVDVVVTKFNQNGEQIWEVIYDYNNIGRVSEFPIDIEVTSEDEFAITSRGALIGDAYDIFTAVYISSGSDVTDEIIAANKFILCQNYPNPFNPVTNIGFRTASFSFVELKVLDLLGRTVATLVSELKTRGEYHVSFNAANLASGVYYYQLKVNGETLTKKMTLLK